MKKRTVYIITGTALALGAVFCIVKLAIMLYQPKASLTATMATSVDRSSTEESSDAEPADPSEGTEDVYVCPVDFEKLQGYNPDIYAWIRINNTNIDYPVVQSPKDDSFYLTHNSDREYSSAGSIFSEHEYNSKDFNDPEGYSVRRIICRARNDLAGGSYVSVFELQSDHGDFFLFRIDLTDVIFEGYVELAVHAFNSKEGRDCINIFEIFSMGHLAALKIDNAYPEICDVFFLANFFCKDRSSNEIILVGIKCLG